MEGDIVANHTAGDNDLVKYMPKLKPEDVADAVLYAITTPDNVQVSIAKFTQQRKPAQK